MTWYERLVSQRQQRARTQLLHDQGNENQDFADNKTSAETELSRFNKNIHTFSRMYLATIHTDCSKWMQWTTNKTFTVMTSWKQQTLLIKHHDDSSWKIHRTQVERSSEFSSVTSVTAVNGAVNSTSSNQRAYPTTWDRDAAINLPSLAGCAKTIHLNVNSNIHANPQTLPSVVPS